MSGERENPDAKWIELNIVGMVSDRSVKEITMTIEEVAGVERVVVDQTSHSVKVSGNLFVPDLVLALAEAGYIATLKTSH